GQGLDSDDPHHTHSDRHGARILRGEKAADLHRPSRHSGRKPRGAVGTGRTPQDGRRGDGRPGGCELLLRQIRQELVKDPSGVSWETFFTFGAATVYGEDTIEDERAAYSTSGISKSFLVKNSTRPAATAAGFLPGKSWLAHGINTVSIFGIHCCSRSAPS